jgi:hypothetical protein
VWLLCAQILGAIITNRQGRLFGDLVNFFDGKEDEDSGEETTDPEAIGLSHDGQAAYEVLRTMGKVVGEIDQTPKGVFGLQGDPLEGHSDWFPEKLAAIMTRTEHWCDAMVRTAYCTCI